MHCRSRTTRVVRVLARSARKGVRKKNKEREASCEVGVLGVVRLRVILKPFLALGMQLIVPDKTEGPSSQTARCCKVTACAGRLLEGGYWQAQRFADRLLQAAEQR